MNYNDSKKTVPESFACQKPNIIIKQIFKVYFEGFYQSRNYNQILVTKAVED
jgi:hypothetical protein